MTAHLTKPVYYYDDNGYKIGPFGKRELIALAERGTIKPDTRITDDKIEVKAKYIPKLKFCAPEYHQSEEIFSIESINLAINPDMVINKVRSPETTIPTNNQSNTDFSNIAYHPMAITAIVLLGITAITSAITCYIVVSVAVAFAKVGKEVEQFRLQERPAFNAPNVDFELPRFEAPKELERDVWLPERNAPPPPRPNR